MNNLERRQKIEEFGNAYYALCDSLREYPREMWDYRPDKDTWSIHEILVHLADSEVSGYVRYRKAIAETGSAIIAYNQEAWATELSYLTQNPNDAVELFRWLRVMSYSLLRAMPEDVFENTINHPEHGIMTLDDLVVSYVVHVENHLGQMRRVYEAWQKYKS